MTYPCPYCRSAADLATGCARCGRGPNPDAAEVARLDAEIATLTARMATAQRTLAATDAELRETWRRRQTAAARVRAALVATPPAAQSTPPSPPSPPGRPPRTPEASTKFVQNALFLLGGLLLGVAAIVFTAVAWSQFGVGGRAALLAAFTGAALAAPPIALRRGLSATAETFAAVGLLLVLLDGYAAWYVNLFGVADYSALGYAGAVCAVTAAVAAGYEHITGLSGPRFVALVVAQPVLPLLVAPLHPDASGWSFTLSAVAVLNLAVVHLRRARSAPLGITAYALAFFSVMGAGSSALVELAATVQPGRAAAGGAALIAAALVPAVAATLARAAVLRAVALGGVVIALDIAGARLASLLGGSTAAPIMIAGVAAVLAAIVTATGPLLSPTVRRGPWIGALVVVAAPALIAVLGALDAAVATSGLARPAFHAPAAVPPGDWRLAAVLVLLVAASVLLLPRTWRRPVIVTGAAMVAFAAPAALRLPWSYAPALDLGAAGVALFVALRSAVQRPSGVLAPVGWPALVAAALAVHAVTIGFGRPGVAAATLSAVSVLGLAVAASARRGPTVDLPNAWRLLGGLALTIALVLIPAIAWTGAVAIGAPGTVQARLALVAAALLVGALPVVSREWPGYRAYALAAVLLAVVSTPAWAIASGDSAAIYAAVSLVLVAITLPAIAAADPAAGSVAARSSVPAGPAGAAARGSVGSGPTWAWLTAVPLGLALLTGAGSSLRAVLADPLGWISRVWSGHPAGTGIDPFGRGHVALVDVVALVLLSAAAGLVAGFVRGREAAAWAAAPALAIVLPMALAAFDVVWPVVPAASLLAGLAGLLTVALRPPRGFGAGGLGAAGTGTTTRPAGGALPAGTAARQAAVAAGTAARQGAVAAGTAARQGAVAAGAAAVHAGISIVLAAAGLAGLLPMQGSTLAGVGAILVAGAMAGAAARRLAARMVGWLTAVASALGVAFTAGRALDLTLPTTAFAVLGAAAAALALGAVFARRSSGPSEADPAGVFSEARVVQAAAHAGAVVALLLTLRSAGHAAVVCTLWGLALGLRALLPGERATVRRALVVAAATVELAGWWLVIGAADVSTLEAYTLPAASVALLAGWLALRSRPGLSSWTAFGPALAAALLPTLASVLVGEGQPVRRLLLGLGALAVLLVGAQTRRQAPVSAGGLVLAVVALHELILVWDLLPRWIPLAAAGLLLVALAMTLERRRRDLSRVRAALARMS